MQTDFNGIDGNDLFTNGSLPFFKHEMIGSVLVPRRMIPAGLVSSRKHKAADVCGLASVARMDCVSVFDSNAPVALSVAIHCN